MTARDKPPQMNRDEVLTLVREHLAEELEVEIEKIDDACEWRSRLAGQTLWRIK